MLCTGEWISISKKDEEWGMGNEVWGMGMAGYFQKSGKLGFLNFYDHMIIT